MIFACSRNFQNLSWPPKWSHFIEAVLLFHRVLQSSLTFLGFELVPDKLGSSGLCFPVLVPALVYEHSRDGCWDHCSADWSHLTDPHSQNSEVELPKAFFTVNLPKPRALNSPNPDFTAVDIKWLCKEKKPKAICRVKLKHTHISNCPQWRQNSKTKLGQQFPQQEQGMGIFKGICQPKLSSEPLYRAHSDSLTQHSRAQLSSSSSPNLKEGQTQPCHLSQDLCFLYWPHGQEDCSGSLRSLVLQGEYLWLYSASPNPVWACSPKVNFRSVKTICFSVFQMKTKVLLSLKDNALCKTWKKETFLKKNSSR